MSGRPVKKGPAFRGPLTSPEADIQIVDGRRAAYGAHGDDLQVWPGTSLGRMISSSQFMKTCTRRG